MMKANSRISAFLGLAVLAVATVTSPAHAVLFRISGNYDVTTLDGVSPAGLIGTFSFKLDVPDALLGDFGTNMIVDNFLGGMSNPVTVGSTTYDASSSTIGIGVRDTAAPGGFLAPAASPSVLFSVSFSSDSGGNCTCADDFDLSYVTTGQDFADALVSPVIIPLVQAFVNSSQGGELLSSQINSGSVRVEAAVPAPGALILLGVPLAACAIGVKKRGR